MTSKALQLPQGHLLKPSWHWQRTPTGFHREMWHYSTEGPTTWFEFARAIFLEYGLEVDTSPCTTAEYPTPAKRPSYSYLDGTPFAKALKLPIVPWEMELKNEVKANENAKKDEK